MPSLTGLSTGGNESPAELIAAGSPCCSDRGGRYKLGLMVLSMIGGALAASHIASSIDAGSRSNPASSSASTSAAMLMSQLV